MSEAPVKQQQYDLDTSWMQHMGEWGMRAEPGKRGLTLTEIQIGSYGDVPELSKNMSGRPRGAGERARCVPRRRLRRAREVGDLAANATFLYEEALQRQWSSATDVPWHTIEPLPDAIEEAECLLCTFFNEVEFVAGDVPARWVANTTPDFLEPRNVSARAGDGRSRATWTCSASARSPTAAV